MKKNPQIQKNAKNKKIVGQLQIFFKVSLFKISPIKHHNFHEHKV